MGLPRDLAKAVRRLDEPQLRQLLILARGLLIDTEAAVVDVDDIPRDAARAGRTGRPERDALDDQCGQRRSRSIDRCRR